MILIRRGSRVVSPVAASLRSSGSMTIARCATPETPRLPTPCNPNFSYCINVGRRRDSASRSLVEHAAAGALG
jgi:hypothetical protein